AAALRVVHPVAGAMIDLEFAHATGKGAVLARVAEGQPVDPDLDAKPGFAITQGIEPCFERVGLPDLDHCTMLTIVHGLSTRVHFRDREAHALPRMEAAINPTCGSNVKGGHAAALLVRSSACIRRTADTACRYRSCRA